MGNQPIPRGRSVKVAVSRPTTIDWTFALSNQSLTEPPKQWLKEPYDATQQHYDIQVPKNSDAKTAAPLILFISPSERPAAMNEWGNACRRSGIIIASPYRAGNNCPGPRRIRIVLDVLGDIRSKFAIDPDRTYIGGFSGGGRMACGIGFSLPEYFGGVIPVCAGGELRTESWLRQRVIDRLSVAQLTGTTDFNRGEVERWHQTELTGVGVRCRTWVPKGGHRIPGESILMQAWKWLEDDLKRRRSFSKRWPASRVTGTITREEWAKGLLAEAKQRLKNPQTLYLGLKQLQGVRVRWQDLASSREAYQLLLEYDRKTDRPWEKDDVAEQRRFLIARARGLDAYGSGPLPKQYVKDRAKLIKAAINYWQQVALDGGDNVATQEAKSRIPQLQKQLSETQ